VFHMVLTINSDFPFYDTVSVVEVIHLSSIDVW
jgi:hypothetical protein